MKRRIQIEDTPYNAAGWKHQMGGPVLQQPYGDKVGQEHLQSFMQYGGEGPDADMDMMKDGGNWIKGAVNPAHKGYCTPMTKSTCTPRRKAFAMTMKKHHGFHKEYGGNLDQWGPQPDQYQTGGGYDPNTPGTSLQPDPNQSTGGPGKKRYYNFDNMFNGMIDAAAGTGAFINSMNNARDVHSQSQRMGMTDNMAHINSPGIKGDYSQQGYFRPQQATSTQAGYFPPAMQMGGGNNFNQYQMGGTYDVSDAEIKRLKKMGYTIEHI